MDALKAIRYRRSVRSYTETPVSEKDLEQLLRLALLAPTGSMSQAWSLLVVRDAEQRAALADDAMARAAVGRDDVHQLNRFVRTDDTCWLDGDTPATRGFLGWMECLRLGINRHLYLGLFDYEAHFARYAPGAFYRRHVDAFGDLQRNRVLSTVLYLNPTWRPGDGGEMVLYAPGEGGAAVETVQPLYGRLAVFLSERFPHEVLTTRTTRFSIAGWFRVNGSVDGQIDPPR